MPSATRDFQYKTEPFKHQEQAFLISRDAEYYAYLMEMGTGKSKVIIDKAAWLYAQGLVNFLLVLAPNGVHLNWVLREVPTHMPDWCNPRVAHWHSTMLKKDRLAYEALWDPSFTGLRVCAINIESFGVPERYYQKKAGKEVRGMLNTFQVMMAIDESSKIKTPGAKRTKRLITLGKHAPYKVIATGTPVTNGPLDLYAQCKFLSSDLLGYSNFYSFKHRYAEWMTERNWKTGKDYETLTGYQNIDELTTNLDRFSFRVTKAECLDLPEKIYERRYVGLTDDQNKKYKKLREDSILQLSNEEEVTVANVLTKMLRLQQLLGGWLPGENPDEPGVPIFDDPMKNPRIKALMDIAEEANGKIIIWARFRQEISAIAQVLRKEFGIDSVGEYHGGVPKTDRDEVIDSFQDPESAMRFFVGQQHSGGYGITLTAATYMIYYSNDFSLEARLQSEDRAHRIGQKNAVTYIDLEVLNSVDSRIINALRSKKKLADAITRDDPSSWL